MNSAFFATIHDLTLKANRATDLMAACPKMGEWLQEGATEDQGGPDDMEIYNNDR